MDAEESKAWLEVLNERDQLRAENSRLREALKQVMDNTIHREYCERDDCLPHCTKAIARAALKIPLDKPK